MTIEPSGNTRRWTAGLLSALLMTFAVQAETNQFLSPAELKRLSFEDLLNQEITIVSRRETRLLESPSAVQVITGEDIRRSGATSLPEALRLAPNLHVAQSDSRQWAISARGFNQPGLLANKLLVMIDGRTVYTPLFAGVFWDVQDTLLEDIRHIEVVSGPGGTLWGANAVNGVINIITKSARDTQGTLVTGSAGNQLNGLFAARYGGAINSNLFFRVYGKLQDRDNTLLRNGRNATNEWRMAQTGMRMDWHPNDENTVTFQADAYGGEIDQVEPGDTTVNGQNVLARWTRVISPDSDFRFQVYFDRTWRNIPNTFAENLRTFDVDFSHHFVLGERHNVTWGAGYRIMRDQVRNSAALSFVPARRDLQVFSAFLQDEITLLPDQLRLTLGSKLEHNDFSGFEYQPSVRLAWLVTERQMIWGAVSRAVRTPSRIDTDFFVPGQPAPGDPFFIAGGKDFKSEQLLAYELGYHWRVMDQWSVSVAAFYHDYDDIRSVETNGPSLTIQNDLEAQSWGAELSTGFQVTDWWHLRGGYTYFHKDVWEKPGRVDFNNARAEGNDPAHQFVLQSMLNLPRNFEFDFVARYVTRLPNPPVPAYFTFDARLGWRYRQNLELAIVGQNLWESRHSEFGAPATRQEIPRSIYGKVTWRF